MAAQLQRSLDLEGREVAGQLDIEVSTFMIMSKGVLGYLYTAKDRKVVKVLEHAMF